MTLLHRTKINYRCFFLYRVSSKQNKSFRLFWTFMKERERERERESSLRPLKSNDILLSDIFYHHLALKKEKKTPNFKLLSNSS